MTLEQQIMKDLNISQTTAHSLAERIGRGTLAVETQLLRMEQQGRVTHRTICDGRLIVWMPSKAQKGAGDE